MCYHNFQMNKHSRYVLIDCWSFWSSRQVQHGTAHSYEAIQLCLLKWKEVAIQMVPCWFFMFWLCFLCFFFSSQGLQVTLCQKPWFAFHLPKISWLGPTKAAYKECQVAWQKHGLHWSWNCWKFEDGCKWVSNSEAGTFASRCFSFCWLSSTTICCV